MRVLGVSVDGAVDQPGEQRRRMGQAENLCRLRMGETQVPSDAGPTAT